MSSTAARSPFVASRRVLGAWASSARISRAVDADQLPVFAAVCSRLLVWAAALGALALFGVRGISPQPPWTEPFHAHAINFLLAPAMRYDSAWYLAIAHGGYATPSATAFFPLYPMLLRAGGTLLGSAQIAGLLISLSATVVAMCLFYRLAQIELDQRAARTSLLLLAFFPTAMFLSAIYTESLFLALSLAVFLAARREHWMCAGILAGFASATRSGGILLCVPLLIMYLYGPRTGGVVAKRQRSWLPRYRAQPSVGWLALVPAGVVAYMSYLAIAHGTPLAPFQAEQYWGREFAGPFSSSFHALLALPGALTHLWTGTETPLGAQNPLSWQAYQLIDIPFLLFGLAGVWLSWRKLPAAYSAYALTALAQALSYPVGQEPLKSLSRYLIVIFPLYMGWGAYLADRTISRRVMLTSCAFGLAAFSGLWGIWAWVA